MKGLSGKPMLQYGEKLTQKNTNNWRGSNNLFIHSKTKTYSESLVLGIQKSQEQEPQHNAGSYMFLKDSISTCIKKQAPQNAKRIASQNIRIQDDK